MKYWGLDADDSAKIRDQLYFPFLQAPYKFLNQAVAGLTLVSRTAPEPLSLVAAERARSRVPRRISLSTRSARWSRLFSELLGQRRFTMLVLMIFAATAMLLAAVGIYGVMSYVVTRRVPELGIRAALGAPRGRWWD